MYFNEELNKDIEKLKELRRLHLTRDFHLYRAEVMKKHNISLATVHRHMDKPTPGLTQSKTADMDKSCAVITDNHLNNISEQLTDAEDERKRERKEFLRRLRDIELFLDRNVCNEATDLLQNFFRKIFDHAFKGLKEERGIFCSIPKEEFIMLEEHIDDICLIFANAYAHYKNNASEINRDDYLKMRVRNLVEQHLRNSGRQWFKVKDVEAFTRMYKRILPDDEKMTLNLNFVQIICNELKPGITRSEIIDLFKKKLPYFSPNFT